MTDFLRSAGGMLWLHSWQVTVVIGVVAVLCGTLLRNRRHLGYALWMLVLFKCLTPPLWSSPVGLFSLAGREQRVVEAGIAPGYEFQTMQAVARDWSIPERAVDDTVTATAQSPVQTRRIRKANRAESSYSSRLSVIQILSGIWIGGAMLFVGWFAVRQVFVRRVVRRYSEPCTDNRINLLFAEIIRRVGVRRKVELLVGPCEVGPATFGVLRPKVIVSQSLLDAAPKRELELIFGHELVHVRRWDTLHALIQTMCQALWWFHPLVWWGNRQIVRQRERCCDEELVAALCRDPAEYAECLVNVLRQRRENRVLPGMAGLGPLDLTRQRLEMIMSFDNRLHSRPPRKHWLLMLLLGAILLPGAGLITATEPQEATTPTERLELVQTITTNALNSASFAVLSPDGRHVYVTAWNVGAITVYSRNDETGELTEQQVVQNDDLAGVTDLRISDDGRIAIGSCCHASTAVVFERSPVSGKLHQLHVARSGEIDVDGLYFPIDIALSPDGKFAYVSDSRRAGRGTEDTEGDFGRVTTFRINDDGTLTGVDTLPGPDRCLDGIRAICSHPDGRTLFATTQRANTLVVLDRDAETGKVSVRQVLSQEKDGLSVLNGAMTAACSPDGQFVYTVGGRFLTTASFFALSFSADGGLIQSVDDSKSKEDPPQGIGVFRLASNGKLIPVQSIEAHKRDDIDLRGGNQLHVSRDGSRLYVSGTTSGTLLSFVRDQKTGKLTLEQTVSSADAKTSSLAGANGIDESPDGRFLYVTGERSNSINVFQRLAEGEEPAGGAGESGVDLKGGLVPIRNLNGKTSLAVIAVEELSAKHGDVELIVRDANGKLTAIAGAGGGSGVEAGELISTLSNRLKGRVVIAVQEKSILVDDVELSKEQLTDHLKKKQPKQVLIQAAADVAAERVEEVTKVIEAAVKTKLSVGVVYSDDSAAGGSGGDE